MGLVLDTPEGSLPPSTPLSVEKPQSQTPRDLEAETNENEKFKLSGIRWFSICVGIYLTAFLYGLDSTIAADVQGPILASLGNLPLLPWVGTGFLLGSVATVALFGTLYNTLEVKWLYLGSIVAFEVGSAICGAAPSMSVMAAGRVLAGVGGSGIYLGGMTYISILTSPTKRPLYIALTTVFWGLGAVLGPVIGGVFAQSNATWRWAFYINLVLAAITAPIYIFWFPRHGTHRGEPILPRVKNLDWLGALLNAATYSLFITACTYSGSQWTWNSSSVITLWVFTFITTAAYVLQQAFAFLTTPETRIFPVWCLNSRSLVLLHIATAGSGAVGFFNTYYIPLFFEFTRGDSAITVAVRLLPFIFLMIFSVVLSGSLLPRLNVYAGWSSISTPTAGVYGFEVLLGAGAGLTMQLAYSIALVKVPANLSASALGFINVSQLSGGALALAIAGTIFQNVGFDRLQDALHGQGYSADEVRAALAGGYSAIISDSTDEVKRQTAEAISTTIATVYIISIAGAAVVLLSGMLMRWEKLKM
ncbi:hypothetical protein VHEMI08210 [[Torrubiella] hemipterigena]|uniref:Major facilitator superfamily (MFS) profile domain-containing protein n=1 Tax=[Torrubiella] hemipterigena TaxID=1531966 RepID=A0A0A1TMT1_9HYPO|nr:hypothetical protein VHEMI08210 [[Torrubiella] hemipterigena]